MSTVQSLIEDHIRNAIRAYAKFAAKKKACDDAEDEAQDLALQQIENFNVDREANPRLLTKNILKTNPRFREYELDAGARNGFQELMRNESQMAIMLMMWDARKQESMRRAHFDKLFSDLDPNEEDQSDGTNTEE